MIRTVPPTAMPEDLFDKFTLNGQIQDRARYLNQVCSDANPRHYSRSLIYHFIEAAAQKKVTCYAPTVPRLYEALDKYSIKGKDAVVFGSTTPWVEGICLHNKVKSVTTIEYATIITDFPKLSIITVEEYNKNRTKFDVAISVSTFEHDGLGRYGDPIDPDDDLKAMKRALDMLNPGGLLFLTVPIGLDTIWWNAHRIYGKLRFPMLTEGWEIVESFGFEENDLEVDTDNQTHEPVFVLRKKQDD